MSEPHVTSSYRWVIIAAGALMTCVGIGAMFSLAIFLQPMSEATGWTRAGISSAMTLNFLVMGAAGFGWGTLSDRYGSRPVVLAGAILLGLALVLASRMTTIVGFQLVYGILVGLAAGAFFAPMIATATAWFTTNRSLAVSLVSAGMGVAPMTISPFAGWLLTTYDWRTAMAVIGVVAWILLIPAAFLVRRAPDAPADDATTATPADDNGLSASAALRTPQFAVLAGTFFMCCAAHAGPIFHMVSYAMTCGVAPLAAVSIYSVEGLAGLGGRVLLGVL
ncbi:MAG: MFS transporter, partial [Rhizobiales bacterium]|nr:MFS transporter [Hyphomicrobiales bacterium]